MSNLILSELEKEGQNIRKSYQRRLPSNTAKDYYFMQRDTGNTEAITVEYGFLDSSGDDVSQLKDNWENYAEAVVRAIIEYLNLTYVPVKGSSYYTVQKGDSLWSIAKKNNVSVSSLKEENGLTNNLLNIGQIIKIPKEMEEPIIDTNTYIVKKGDTLYKIANIYNTTVSDLIKLNSLSNTNLSIGQVIKLPAKNFNTYVVKSGDSLYKIANIYNTTVDNLKKLNNLTTNLLNIGQVLNVPLSESNIYIVKSGDNLYKIARENNTTVQKIKELNNLTSDILNIGQKLSIK